MSNIYSNIDRRLVLLLLTSNIFWTSNLLLILLFLLLYYFNILFEPGNLKFQTVNLLPVTVRNISSYGPGKYVGLHVFTQIHQTRLQKNNFSRHSFKKISRALPPNFLRISLLSNTFKILL